MAGEAAEPGRQPIAAYRGRLLVREHERARRGEEEPGRLRESHEHRGPRDEVACGPRLRCAASTQRRAADHAEAPEAAQRRAHRRLSLERRRLWRARRDPAADQIELRGRERPADERHAHALGRGDVPQKLLEEEAPVRIPGRDAQQAGSLGGWVRRQHPNETLAGSAWQQAQAASGGAVTRLARAPSAKRRSMSANGDRFCDG